MTKRDREPFDHAMFRAPYGDRGTTWNEKGQVVSGREYFPISRRTGRMVSQTVAEQEFSESFDAITTRDHPPGGLWDREKEAAMRLKAGCKLPTAIERYDAEAMRAFGDARSHTFTDLELQVYTMFWAGKLSYGQIGREVGKEKARIRECVQRLRARCDEAGFERPRW